MRSKRPQRPKHPKRPVSKSPRPTKRKPAISETGPQAIIRLNPLRRSVPFAHTASALTNGKAQTAVYVHGIGKHPPEQLLMVRWGRALLNKDMDQDIDNRDHYCELS